MSRFTTEYKHIFVSSENRDTTLYPSGNAYTLVTTHPIKMIKRVELLHASIPNTLYNLTNGSNVIQLSNIASGSSDPVVTFSLPPGFYSGTGLATELTAAITNVTGITVSYLQNEGEFAFTRTGNTFALTVTSTELSKMLGFSNATTYTSTTVSPENDLNIPLYSNHTRYTGKNFIKSASLINFHPNEGIFLDIEELRSTNNEDAVPLVGNTFSGNNISRTFGFIPMDVNGGDIKRYNKMSDYDFAVDYPHPIPSIYKLTVQWLDKNGTRVNFNGANDHSFVLRFHTFRKI